jgi:hypothetical protein
MASEDERRQPTRYGYDPARNKVLREDTAQGLANRWGGIWDSARTALNDIQSGIQRGQPQQDYYDKFGIGSPVSPNRMNPQPPQGDIDQNQNRDLRIAQARAGDSQPVMSEPRTPNYSRTAMQEPPPEQAVAGVGQQEPVPNEQPSSHTRVSASVIGGAGGNELNPRMSPSDRQVFNAPASTVDVRNRALEMAGWDLAKRNAYLDSLPEGQRPIQTIRGNREGWYNPSLSKEFSGLPEALSGVEGRPTYGSEQLREEEARKRQNELEKQRLERWKSTSCRYAHICGR